MLALSAKFSQSAFLAGLLFPPNNASQGPAERCQDARLHDLCLQEAKPVRRIGFAALAAPWAYPHALRRFLQSTGVAQMAEPAPFQIFAPFWHDWKIINSNLNPHLSPRRRCLRPRSGYPPGTPEIGPA